LVDQLNILSANIHVYFLRCDRSYLHPVTIVVVSVLRGFRFKYVIKQTRTVIIGLISLIMLRFHCHEISFVRHELIINVEHSANWMINW